LPPTTADTVVSSALDTLPTTADEHMPPVSEEETSELSPPFSLPPIITPQLPMHSGDFIDTGGGGVQQSLPPDIDTSNSNSSEENPDTGVDSAFTLLTVLFAGMIVVAAGRKRKLK